MKKAKSVILLFLTAIIWGLAFVAQRVGAEYVGTFTFNGIRFLLGAISLLPVIFFFEMQSKDTYNKEKLKKTAFVGFLAGIILFTASTLQQAGIDITKSAGKAGFITGLYMVIVPFIGIFMHKKTNVYTWLGALCAVLGLYLLCVTENSGIGYGDFVLLAGSVFWAFHIIIIDSFVEDIYPLRFAAIQFFVCGLISIICALCFEKIEFSAIKSALVPILYGGFMSVGVAYTCQILGQKDADPAFASVILCTESVFAAIGEAIILGTTLSLRGYLGCVVMFAGIILSQITPKRKNETSSLRA